MQQAQGAIDAARAAGADQYAHEEFAAAVDALKGAQDAAADRDYRLALNHALDSRERAQNAAKLASDQKAVARSDARGAVSALSDALAAAQKRLKAAEAGRVGARRLNGPRHAITDAERRLQEARTAFDKGDYQAATAAASATTAQLAAATRDLEAVTAAPARRRR